MTGPLDTSFIEGNLTRAAAWAESHGARGTYLGAGLLYYTLAYMTHAITAVCLGSGGGFVPRLLRQAQRDLEIEGSRTILVDANLPEAGWGSPQWLDEESFFRKAYPEVELVLETTLTAAASIFAPAGLVIDYLHVDADHSCAAIVADLAAYRPLLAPDAVVTLHDTSYPGAGVADALVQIRAEGAFDVVDFPEVAAGTAVLRLR